MSFLNVADPDTISIVADYIRDNKVCVFPCDTIYGFIGKVPESAGKIAKLKNRPREKQFLMLALKEHLKNITPITIDPALLSLWPAQFTLIVPGFNNNTVAVRVPDNIPLQALLKELDFPIYSTSVNRSGTAPMNSIVQIRDLFGEMVPCYVEGPVDSSGKASTILDICELPYTIVRPGAYQFPDFIQTG